MVKIPILSRSEDMEDIKFAKTFWSPHKEYEKFNGLTFNVMYKVAESTKDKSELWDIVLEDGTDLWVFLDEITEAGRIFRGDDE